MATQIQANVATTMKTLLKDPSALEKEFEDLVMEAMEDDGKLSWPEAEAIIVHMLPKVIEYHLEEAKKHGASDEDIAKAREWIKEHYDELEAYVLSEIKKGFMACDQDGDKKLDEKELKACIGH